MAQMLLVNPSKRKTHKRRAKRRSNPVAKVASTRRRRRSNPVTSLKKRVHHRRRRNPVAGKLDLMSNVKEAAMGAAGALVLDFAFAYVPLPANLKTGNIRAIAKVGVSFGLGMLASKFGASKAMVRQMVQGAMTSTMHDAARGILAKNYPQLNLNEYVGGAEYVGGVDDLFLSESPINQALSGNYGFDGVDDLDGMDDDLGEYVGNYPSQYNV